MISRNTNTCFNTPEYTNFRASRVKAFQSQYTFYNKIDLFRKTLMLSITEGNRKGLRQLAIRQTFTRVLSSKDIDFTINANCLK